MPERPEVSIIIRTKNEAAHIEKTLKAVFAQRHNSFEVIIVDSGSTDETIEIASKFPVTIIHLKPEAFSYGRALNLGFEKGRGEICVSLSAHALPFDRAWLRNIIAPFQDQKVAGVVGKTLPFPDCNPFDRRGLLRHFHTQRSYLHYDSIITFSNANAASRRSVWEKKPFDESLPYSEDVKWSREMMRQNWRFVYEPTAAVYHSHNESTSQLFNRFYNESNARGKMGYEIERFSKLRLIWDLMGGTVYDWMTAIYDRELFWFIQAFPRRYWINMGRYYGSRNMDPRRRFPLLGIMQRWVLKILRGANNAMSRLAPVLVEATHKHDGRIHPKRLLGEHAGQFWYDEYLDGADSLLDVGCGQGTHLLHAAKSAKWACGLDTNKRNLFIANFLARWDGRQNVTLAAASNGTYPFETGIFDRVIAFDTLASADDPKTFFKETARVLKNDGLLLLVAPKSDTCHKQRLRRAGLANDQNSPVQNGFTNDDLVQLAGDAGFALEAKKPAYADTPLEGFYDMIGGLSLGAYGRIMRHRHLLAKNNPNRSNELRMVFKKSWAS